MKISIITVVLNNKEGVERAIESVIDQKYAQKELIVIDGGSTDGTVDIIKKYESYIDYWVSEPDGGIYDAMNKGIKATTGDVVAFLNSDDWYEPNSISEMMDYFAKDGSVDAVWGKANRISEGEKIGVFGVNIDEFYRQMPGCHQALFARKRLYDEIGDFDVEYKITADYDWFIRCYFANKNIQLVDSVLVNYNIDGLSATNARKAREEDYTIIKKHACEQNRPDLMGLIEKGHKDNLLYLRWHEAMNTQGIAEHNGDKLRRVYLWGTGEFGEWIMQLLNKCQVSIRGFIESSPKSAYFNGYAVIGPNEVDCSSTIVIATLRYQDEILNMCKKIGINRNQLVTIEELLDLLGV